MNLRDLQQQAWQQAEDAGWHEDRTQISDLISPFERRAALQQWQGMKIALMHSELSEALEELRDGRAANETYYPFRAHGETLMKPEGVPSELADVVIRIMDFCGDPEHPIDLQAIIEEKLAYNATRAYKHGRNF